MGRLLARSCRERAPALLQRKAGRGAVTALIQRQSGTRHIPGVGDIAVPSSADEARRARTRQQGQEERLPVYRDVVTRDQLVFRGDSRHPSEIFEIGFTQRRVRQLFATNTAQLQDLVRQYGPEVALAGALLIDVSGEKVQYGISTSKDQGVVRRKYGHGNWIYAAVYPYGYDMGDVNDLEEVSGYYIPPENIIAAVGPIVESDDDYSASEMLTNRRCTVPVEIVRKAVGDLRDTIRMSRVQEAP